MSVLGVGLDLCAIGRMEKAVARHGDRFLRRIFTDAEVRYAEGRGNPYESLAARFAAKEATSKALGAPLGIGWHDVEVIAARPGERGPEVVLRGKALEVAVARGITRVHLSLTHAEGMAAAVAVAVT